MLFVRGGGFPPSALLAKMSAVLMASAIQDRSTPTLLYASPSSRITCPAFPSAFAGHPHLRQRKTAWLSRFLPSLYPQSLQVVLVQAAGTRR